MVLALNLAILFQISKDLALSFTYDKTDIDIGTSPAREIWDFVNAEGEIFETLTAQASWQRITLNRGTFPTRWRINSIKSFLNIAW